MVSGIGTDAITACGQAGNLGGDALPARSVNSDNIQGTSDNLFSIGSLWWGNQRLTHTMQKPLSRTPRLKGVLRAWRGWSSQPPSPVGGIMDAYNRKQT